METVTPLFLGGSNPRDPRDEPELRAASFRGALRFWFRALLGGVLGDKPDDIFRYESQVFGSTEHASSVVLQLSHPYLSKVSYSQISRDRKGRDRKGIGYLFFGARGVGSERERQAVADGLRFTCTIRQRNGVQDAKALQAAYAALWLLTHLGGLGMRSRKGGGNLQVVSTDWNEPSLPSLTVQAQTPKQLQETLQDGLHKLRKWAAETFNGSLSLSFQATPSFDILHPNYCRINIINHEFNNWAEALDTFGQVMQQFRNRRQPDYSNVKAVLQGSDELESVQRAVFGLPIVFYFSSLKKRATLEGEKHNRRASPLIVRVTKLANGKFVLVLIHFHSQFLPENERLQLRYDDQKVFTEQPSDNLLNNFLSHLEHQIAPFLEVKNW